VGGAPPPRLDECDANPLSPTWQPRLHILPHQSTRVRSGGHPIASLCRCFAARRPTARALHRAAGARAGARCGREIAESEPARPATAPRVGGSGRNGGARPDAVVRRRPAAVAASARDRSCSTSRRLGSGAHVTTTGKGRKNRTPTRSLVVVPAGVRPSVGHALGFRAVRERSPVDRGLLRVLCVRAQAREDLQRDASQVLDDLRGGRVGVGQLRGDREPGRLAGSRGVSRESR
jgi:hypothetical protein